VLPPATRPASPGSRLAAPTARLILPKGAPEEQWHAVRRTGLGGSDIAAVVGLDRYRSAMHVYEAKHGRDDYTDSMAAYCGRMLEPVIAAIFSELSGLPLAEPPGTLQHVDRLWMLANIDTFAVEADGALAPVEVKNRNWRASADWEHETPDAPALQASWYLAVTGYSHAYAVALIGGNVPRWYRIERDEELIEHLVHWCGRWWDRHIVQGVRPDPDGSQATTELLAHLWDAQRDVVAEVDPIVTAGLLEEAARLRAGIRALENQLGRVQNRLRAQLGDAEIAAIDGRPTYTWRQNGTFREKDFRKDHPQIAAEYTRLLPHTDTERLAADHEDLYRQYRARRLYVPPKGSTA
jgi:putative phage-type endonuclease